jgi:hypothetical protein
MIAPVIAAVIALGIDQHPDVVRPNGDHIDIADLAKGLNVRVEQLVHRIALHSLVERRLRPCCAGAP